MGNDYALHLEPGRAIKEMVHQSQSSQKKLAELAGYKHLSSVTTPIARNDMLLSSMIRLADALGYDLMLVKRHNIENQPIIVVERPAGQKEADAV